MIDLNTDRVQLGFTFVELVITVTILGILSSIALVNLSSSWKNNRLLSSTRELENWLSTQRSYAMTHGLTCRIVIDVDAKQLFSRIDVDNSNTPCTIDSSNPNDSSFDLSKSFGDGNEKVTLSLNPPPEEGHSTRVIRLQHQGFSQDNQLNAQGELKDGNIDDGVLELKLQHEDLDQQRCIRILSPIGMIRDGRAEKGSSDCNYDKTS